MRRYKPLNLQCVLFNGCIPLLEASTSLLDSDSGIFMFDAEIPMFICSSLHIFRVPSVPFPTWLRFLGCQSSPPHRWSPLVTVGHRWSSSCASLAKRPPSKAPSSAASRTVVTRSHGSAMLSHDPQTAGPLVLSRSIAIHMCNTVYLRIPCRYMYMCHPLCPHHLLSIKSINQM